MKRKFITTFLLCVGMITFGQKTIEKNLTYSGQPINMEVKFAKNIEVKTWNKSEIYFKAVLDAEQQYLDLYELNLDENSKEIKIESNPDKVFKKMYEDKKSEHEKSGSGNCFTTADEYEFNYVLYVPKNSSLKVSSINGDLNVSELIGDFEADLINGNIEIDNYAGNLTLSTINGVIDLKIHDVKLHAETIHGNIYGDDDLKFTVKDNVVGREVKGEFDSALYTLKLDTINGDMYLRKG